MSKPLNGGAPARRAVIRWALRLFRREWRQQLLVIALLSLAVLIAVGGASAAYNSAPRRDAEFGTADHRLVFDVSESDPAAVDAYLAAAEDWFGTIDVIGQRRVRVPGSTETLELRAQDPDGAYSGPMLRLREGRYPTRAGEVALTDEVAQTFGLTVGDRLTIEGEELTVVGTVENPNDLSDDFALAAPSESDRLDTLTVLVRGSEEKVMSSLSSPAVVEPSRGSVETRGVTEKGAAAAGALAASAVVLLLVCLIAAAGFVVVAQRRLRQMGMLAATGATLRHLRLVVVANGAVVGVTAAIIGAVAGLAGWTAIAPRMESVAGHRIERFDLPWPQVGLGMLLAVVAASAAAWWPARTMARVPITRALSGRPPRPRAARRSLVLAALLVAVGVASLMAGIDATKDEADARLAILGALAIPLGMVFLCPPAIRALAPLATRLPVAARLALRDLARYQARSGAALAAISLGLGITVAIVLAASAAEARPDEGNLSDSQLIIRIDQPNEVGSPATVPEQTPAELEASASVVDRIAGAIGDPTVVALDVPFDPAVEEPGAGETFQPSVVLAKQVDENTYRDVAPLYVATPEVLAYVGLDSASIDPGTDVLTPQPGPVFLVNTSDRPAPVEAVEAIDVPAYSSAPRSFITADAVRRHGWETARAAWLVDAPGPLTSDQVAEARRLAADAGMTIEVRSGQQGLSQLRSAATGAGLLLALGIVAMTVGLVRSETAADVRTLTAAGASSRIRRSVTGVTTGTLALLGAALGTAGAYAGLGAGYADDIGALSPVPILNLVAIAVGLPLVAAAAGWLLAGREPPSLTRNPIE